MRNIQRYVRSTIFRSERTSPFPCWAYSQMSLVSFIEGPLPCSVFVFCFVGISANLLLFVSGVVRDALHPSTQWRRALVTLGRSLLPFHNGLKKKPIYASLRYAYHFCLFVVPVYLWGHVVLWEESRFELRWSTLPDIWADRLTIFVVCMSFYFLFRRFALAQVRSEARLADFALPLVVVFPFLSGYLLAHGTLEHLSFFKKNLWTLHVITGEIALISTVFLIVRNRIQTTRCTGCAACSIRCPTGALFYTDTDSRRVFTYDDSRCIHCGACVRDCPESAAEIGHQINLGVFFGRRFSQDMRHFDLQECIRCGVSFAPRLQCNKIAETLDDISPLLCLTCRRNQLLRVLLRGDLPLFPRRGEQEDASQMVSACSKS